MSLIEDEEKFLQSVKAQLNESLIGPWPDTPEFKPVNILVDEVMTRYQRRAWLRQAVIVSAGCVGGLIGLSQFFRARAGLELPKSSLSRALDFSPSSLVQPAVLSSHKIIPIKTYTFHLPLLILKRMKLNFFYFL
jgi:hypothetical protein